MVIKMPNSLNVSICGIAILRHDEGGFALFHPEAQLWTIAALDRLATDHVGLLLERAAAMLKRLDPDAGCEVAVMRADLPDDFGDVQAVGFGDLFGGRRVTRGRLTDVVAYLGAPADASVDPTPHLEMMTWAAAHRVGLQTEQVGYYGVLALGAALVASAAQVEMEKPYIATPADAALTSAGRPTSRPPLPSASRRWLSVADVVAEYGWSRSKVYELARHIPRHRPPGLGLVFDRREIEAHLRRYTIQPKSSDAPKINGRVPTHDTGPDRALRVIQRGDPHRHGL